jgi:hypothetical protein
MKINKTILLSVIIIICISASAGATYFYIDNEHQEQLTNISSYYNTEMGNLQNQILNLSDSVFSFNNEIYILQDNLNSTNNELQNINASLVENLTELEYLKTGNKYQQHDPLYSEVATFIANDRTDELPYDDENFDCDNYVELINNNAENQGIRCALVIIYFYDSNAGHALVGFNTADKGMVYIEPQTDDWVENLEIGNDYWSDCVIPSGNYDYEEKPDDTIRQILHIW